MHVRRHIPFIVALLANGALAIFLAELNHFASRFSIQLLLPACFILYPGLCLGYSQGLLVSFLAGICLDASIPPLGEDPDDFFSYFTVALPLFHLVIHRISPKLHKEGGLDSLLLAQALNLLLLLHLAFGFSRHFHSPLLSNFLQILLSQTALLLIAPIHLALQIAVTAFLGIDANDEDARAA